MQINQCSVIERKGIYSSVVLCYFHMSVVVNTASLSLLRGKSKTSMQGFPPVGWWFRLIVSPMSFDPWFGSLVNFYWNNNKKKLCYYLLSYRDKGRITRGYQLFEHAYHSWEQTTQWSKDPGVNSGAPEGYFEANIHGSMHWLGIHFISSYFKNLWKLKYDTNMVTTVPREEPLYWTKSTFNTQSSNHDCTLNTQSSNHDCIFNTQSSNHDCTFNTHALTRNTFYFIIF
jgi:hypothetical protein